MSLEAAIRELNDNVLTLTKALVDATPASLRTPAPTKPVTGKAEAPKALDYDKDVKPVALKLLAAKNGRERMLEVLKKHGATTAQNLKPEQYAAFIKDVNAEIAK